MYLYGIEMIDSNGKAVIVTGLNCTFMELKFEKDSDGTFVAYGLNCTFMELKFGSVFDD